MSDARSGSPPAAAEQVEAERRRGERGTRHSNVARAESRRLIAERAVLACDVAAACGRGSLPLFSFDRGSNRQRPSCLPGAGYPAEIVLLAHPPAMLAVAGFEAVARTARQISVRPPLSSVMIAQRDERSRRIACLARSSGGAGRWPPRPPGRPPIGAASWGRRQRPTAAPRRRHAASGGRGGAYSCRQARGATRRSMPTAYAMTFARVPAASRRR